MSERTRQVSGSHLSDPGISKDKAREALYAASEDLDCSVIGEPVQAQPIQVITIPEAQQVDRRPQVSCILQKALSYLEQQPLGVVGG
jgi:hypothetical protein